MGTTHSEKFAGADNSACSRAPTDPAFGCGAERVAVIAGVLAVSQFLTELLVFLGWSRISTKKL